MIEISNVCKSFKDNIIFKNINFVCKNEIVSILGKSGSGKSTLLKLILGVEKDYDGDISVDGCNIEDEAPKIGYISQNSSLYPWLDLKKNLQLPLDILKIKDIDLDSFLKKFDLYKYKNHKISQLSVGMQKRAMIIRVIISKLSNILIDEAFSSLDYFLRFEIYDYILKLQNLYSLSVINVTHDIDEAIILSKKVYIISDKSLKDICIDVDDNLRNKNIFNTPEYIDLKNKILNYL